MLRIILSHLKSQWYKYVIEVIVVILGILIAFNLEQWAEDRNNKRKEIEVLKEFKTALSADLSEIRENIQMHDYSILSSNIILRVIKDNLPYNDSLDACFAHTHAFTTFSGRVGPIEQLKNSNLAIIVNGGLRMEIISMYDEAYPRIRKVELAIQRDYEQLRDFDRLYFDVYDIDNVSTNKNIPAPFWGIMHPIRFTDLKTNPEYAALLRARISNQVGLLRGHYIPTEKALVSLLNKITTELNRLE